eukprot:CAMPEP_0119547844 /NCGR_PEP_ID=MMETSP1352-20130426/1881_1 /TAXON_ID=265584 /ORGANISM="Stauroneis constricta, Strain CCMP1120" /LENGTH=446 /DNA_ID=CAMNT_0007592901 /DNA_START=51 /DNA_END=1391 /DNA_ORIENTATION=-
MATKSTAAAAAAAAAPTDAESKPHRCIFNDVDMKHFMDSPTKKGLLNFVEAMGRSCASSTAPLNREEVLVGMTPAMACLHGALGSMVEWLDDFPPINEDTARFGNVAFRQWHQRLQERSNAIITAILLSRDDADLPLEDASNKGKDAASGEFTADEDPAILQVSAYLHDGFGHATRLDYGTGHESSFVVFLFVLSKVGCFGKQTPSLECLRAITVGIFDQYLKVTRKLQTIYRLEPAGSHGVWGLDDYHCLPFYFGACQLSSTNRRQQNDDEPEQHHLPHELTMPKCFAEDRTLDDYADSYLFLSCIQYIRTLKKGVPFFESSPMLYDISQTVPTWEKVGRGLLRMYEGEVLDKRQVVQHFLFGKYFAATWTPSQTERRPPASNFRDPAIEASQIHAGGGSARRTTPAVPFESTRAPWANQSPARPSPAPSGAEDLMVPTKAPWAK